MSICIVNSFAFSCSTWTVRLYVGLVLLLALTFVILVFTFAVLAFAFAVLAFALHCG